MVTSTSEGASHRALIEVTPELQRRLRDPRVILGWLAIIAGAVALLIGYWGVSGTLRTGKQMPYLISGGLGGIFLLGLGAALLFGSELSEARKEIAEVRELIEGLYETREEAGLASSNNLVALARANTFHQGDCVVVANKPGVASITRTQIERRGLTPCRLCSPVV